MLYVKKKLKGVEITIDIDYDNVFTRCPVCGREIMVDLNDIDDVYTTNVYCAVCHTVWRSGEHHEKR